jgi:hypothetical protein
LPDGQITPFACLRLSIPPSKNISPIVVGQITFKTSPHSAPARGAYRDRHGRWARNAMDGGCVADERAIFGRRSRVVLTPRRWRQVGDNASHYAGDGDNKPGHRGEHEVSRKTIARGMPDCIGEPVVTNSPCYLFFAREAAGAARTRHSLRPLFGGTTISYRPGASRVAGMRRCAFAFRPREVCSL